MEWAMLFFAFIAALAMTGVAVGGAGWRRPGAPSTEGVVLSALFFFLLVFAGSWAISHWLVPWGPTAWGAPWLSIVTFALFVTLLILAVRPLSPKAEQPEPDAPATAAAAGFGLFFWLIVALLLFAGMAPQMV